MTLDHEPVRAWSFAIRFRASGLLADRPNKERWTAVGVNEEQARRRAIEIAAAFRRVHPDELFVDGPAIPEAW